MDKTWLFCGHLLTGWTDHMHDPVAARLEGAQESRKHGRRLLLRIMKQHDPAMGGFKSCQHQAQLLPWGHRVPVAGPQVGTEYHNLARRKAIQQGRRRGEARKAEKRCVRPLARLAIEGGVDRREAV